MVNAFVHGQGRGWDKGGWVSLYWPAKRNILSGYARISHNIHIFYIHLAVLPVKLQWPGSCHSRDEQLWPNHSWVWNCGSLCVPWWPNSPQNSGTEIVLNSFILFNAVVCEMGMSKPTQNKILGQLPFFNTPKNSQHPYKLLWTPLTQWKRYWIFM